MLSAKGLGSLGRLAALASLATILVACGDDASMSQAEIDAIKTSPAMTEKDRERVAQGMAGGAEAARQQQKKWADENAAKLAKVNAERAAMGRPPLGQ